MPAKKKIEDTETTTVKTPRKRAAKKAIEAEAIINNDSIEVKEINEVNEVSEVSEVNHVDENKLLEITSNSTVDAKEGNELANLEVVDTTTDNNQINASNEDNAQEATSNKKQRQPGSYVQRKFYERVIGEKIEVTVQLEKLKMTGVITYESRFYILLETKQGEQFIYKQSISYICTKRSFTKLARRDRPFFNRENVDGDNSASPTNEQANDQNNE
ncbi:MAG: RNA chaperone Hfq [Blastocatellia bacterium]